MSAQFKSLPWLIAATAVVLSTPAAADHHASGVKGTLVVDISNIQNDKGQIGCSLFSKKDGFPTNAEKADFSLFVKQRAGKATCAFKGIKPGEYAVSVMHDSDKDGKLKTSLVGRPK